MKLKVTDSKYNKDYLYYRYVKPIFMVYFN